VSTKGTLLQGTLVLVIAQFASKFMGFIYKAVLARIIGAVGLGLYEKVYPIYTLLLTVSIVGIPVAISKLVAEKRAQGEEEEADYIFRVALKVNISLGILAALLIGILARPIARYLLDDGQVVYSVWAITPAILVVSIMATYRGYFQGYKRMVPTAVSQVSEQLVRMISMIVLAYILMPYGVEYGAAGAVSGAFFGAVAGLVVMLIVYHRFQRRRNTSSSAANSNSQQKLPTEQQVRNRIFSVALPVTVGALILPLMRLIDAVMITRRLKAAGFDLKTATSLYGQFNGMAMTLVRFPTVVATALAVNLVPNISEAYTLNQDKLLKNRITKAFKLALYVSIPASLGLFILAQPLCKIIFATPEAAVSLRYVAWGVIAVSLQQITASILQGFERPKLPARNLFWGAVLNIGLNYYLTARPELGIRGAALGTLSGFTLAAGLNIINVFRISKPQFNYKELLIKPMLSGIMMMGIVYLTYQQLASLFVEQVVVTLGSVLIGIISYSMLLLLTGGVTKSDLRLVPYIGDKLLNLLEKLGLVRD